MHHCLQDLAPEFLIDAPPLHPSSCNKWSASYSTTVEKSPENTRSSQLDSGLGAPFTFGAIAHRIMPLLQSLTHLPSHGIYTYIPCKKPSGPRPSLRGSRACRAAPVQTTSNCLAKCLRLSSLRTTSRFPRQNSPQRVHWEALWQLDCHPRSCQIECPFPRSSLMASSRPCRLSRPVLKRGMPRSEP